MTAFKKSSKYRCNEVHLRLLRLSSRRLTHPFSSTPANQQPELAEYLKLHDIQVRGAKGDVYTPMTSFENTPFPPSIINALYSEGFTAPTPIQAQSWPIALAGKDMVSVARTGSGKTCAFLLPGFLKVLSNKDALTPPMGAMGRKGKFPQTLVLAPTRELTQQIVDEANKFSRTSGLVVAPFYGGTPKGPQLRQLSRGVDIVVGTPGRCNDLLEMGALDLSAINYLVLDEADRMLDMGFEPQIRTLINRCNTNRQNLFFTATWPKDIAQLAADYLTNPVSVHIGGADTLNANKAIQQTVHVVKEFEKSYRLEELMETLIPTEEDSQLTTVAQRRRAAPKTLIFLARKLECDDLAYELRDLGYLVGTLHGDKEQTARTKIMNKFRTGEIRVLVATDVAARGIDIKDIEVVINYDFPSGKSSAVEDYVHRIGRTARGERTGIAHTFFTPDNAAAAPALVQLLERSGQNVPPELRAFVMPKSSRSDSSRSQSKGRFGNSSKGKFSSGNSQKSFDPIASGGGNKRKGGEGSSSSFKRSGGSGGKESFFGGRPSSNGQRRSAGESESESESQIFTRRRREN